MHNKLAMSVSEAVETTGVGRTTLYGAMQRGELPVRKLGRRTIILRADLERWLASLPQAHEIA